MAKLAPVKGDEASLTRELRRVGERGLARAFQRVGDGPPLEVPILRRIVQAWAPSEYNANPTLALQRVLLEAIDLLPDEPTPKYKDLTWRRLARWLYEPESPLDYDKRVQDTRQFCGLPRKSEDHDHKFMLSDMRVLLARKLLQMERNAKEPPSVQPPDLEYVPRPNLDAEFDNAIRSRVRVILIHGDAGTGKTTFAQHAARRFLRIAPDDYVPTVRVTDDALLLDSLRSVGSRRCEGSTALDAILVRGRSLRGACGINP